MKMLRILIGLALVLLPALALADAEFMPPGKWETKTRMEFTHPRLPPNVQAVLDTKLLEQLSNEKISRTCVRAEKRKWSEEAQFVHTKTKVPNVCESRDFVQNGNKMTWNFICTSPAPEQPEIAGSGELTYGNDSYSSVVVIYNPVMQQKIFTEGRKIADTCEKS